MSNIDFDIFTQSYTSDCILKACKFLVCKTGNNQAEGKYAKISINMHNYSRD